MRYLIIGINHKTALISIREKVAFSTSQLKEALLDAYKNIPCEEIAILSTCNRTEIFCKVLPQTNEKQILSWLTTYHNIDYEIIKEHFYSFIDNKAIEHIAKVSCGLDSMIIGEPQILGQLKQAYSVANEARVMGSHLNRLFQFAFSVAKNARTNTKIGQFPVSIAYAVTSLAKQIFSDLKENTVLFIGAGQMIELTAKHFYHQGLKNLIFVNRTLENALQLSKKYQSRAATLNNIPDILPETDIIVSSTGSQVPILGKGVVESALKKRKHKPFFMIDIAVPRDIEKEVGNLADVYLYTIDDLNGVIEDNKYTRQMAAKEVNNLIKESIKKFENNLRSLSATSIITNYRKKINSIKEIHIKKALHNLRLGKNPEDVLKKFSHVFTNKLMHNPSIKLKEIAIQKNQQKLDWAIDFLEIKSKNNDI